MLTYNMERLTLMIYESLSVFFQVQFLELEYILKEDQVEVRVAVLSRKGNAYSHVSRYEMHRAHDYWQELAVKLAYKFVEQVHATEFNTRGKTI